MLDPRMSVQAWAEYWHFASQTGTGGGYFKMLIKIAFVGGAWGPCKRIAMPLTRVFSFIRFSILLLDQPTRPQRSRHDEKPNYQRLKQPTLRSRPPDNRSQPLGRINAPSKRANPPCFPCGPFNRDLSNDLIVLGELQDDLRR
jgi:hypothetical protein